MSQEITSLVTGARWCRVTRGDQEFIGGPGAGPEPDNRRLAVFHVGDLERQTRLDRGQGVLHFSEDDSRIFAPLPSGQPTGPASGRDADPAAPPVHHPAAT